MDIITIALCALISGANDWEAVAAFGRAKESWLWTFLRLGNGIPSADTFERVFAQIDPRAISSEFYPLDGHPQSSDSGRGSGD